MPAIQITYERCGHTDTVNISGGDRHSKAAYAAKHYICRACEAKAAASDWSKRVAEAITSVDVSAEHIPALTGSPKQMEWATKLRANRIVEMVREIGNYDTDDQPLVRSLIAGMIRTKTDSVWWIENRELQGGDIVVLLDEETI